MRRAAPTMPVNAKMYRHFAVISLTLTAGLAMFANSGNREALDHIADKSEAQASPKKVVSNFKDNRKGSGSFGEEAGSASAGGATAFTGGAGTVAAPELVAASEVVIVPSESAVLPDGAVNGLPPGMTPEEILAWQAWQKKQSAPAPAANEPSASEIAATVAASKARSRTPGG